MGVGGSEGLDPRMTGDKHFAGNHFFSSKSKPIIIVYRVYQDLQDDVLGHSRGGSRNFGWGGGIDIICSTYNLSATPFLQISLSAGQSLGGLTPSTPPPPPRGSASALANNGAARGQEQGSQTFWFISWAAELCTCWSWEMVWWRRPYIKPWQ